MSLLREQREGCYDARGLLIPERLHAQYHAMAQQRPAGHQQHLVRQQLMQAAANPAQMLLGARAEMILGNLRDLGWPEPLIFADGDDRELVWGDTEAPPWLSVGIFKGAIGLSFDCKLCQGSAGHRGTIPELIAAIDCFRWVLGLPGVAEYRFKKAVEDARALARKTGAAYRVSLDGTIRPAAEAEAAEVRGGIGGAPPSGREIDEVVGRVGLSEPRVPKRELTPFPTQATSKWRDPLLG